MTGNAQPIDKPVPIIPEGIGIHVGYVSIASPGAHPWGFPVMVNLGLESGRSEPHYLTEAGFVALCAAIDAFREAARSVTSPLEWGPKQGDRIEVAQI